MITGAPQLGVDRLLAPAKVGLLNQVQALGLIELMKSYFTKEETSPHNFNIMKIYYLFIA